MSQPARLGRYAVRRRIGAGGFATVWLAYDEQLDSPVAVKVLEDNWAEDQHVRRRFVEEGRFLRKVDSPHVVPVYDAGEVDDGRPFLVMAYADQGNLVDRLAGGPLALGASLSVIRQVALGLRALHQRNVLHRDLKPANVLFRTAEDDEGQVRAMVGDLGLGKALDMSSRLTMIGGTPSYVSPEQARGESLDPRSDVYSLGALAYQLLTGRPPYSHASLVAAGAPTPPPPMGDHLPVEVEAVVRRALAPQREERWPSAVAFADALALAARGLAANATVEAIPADPQLTQPAPRPSPWPTSAARGGAPGAPPGAETVRGDTQAAPEGILGWGSVPDAAALDVDSDAAPASARPRWSRRLGWIAAALVVAGFAGLAGYAAFSRVLPTVTVDEGTLSVRVPRSWSAHLATEPWTPPGSTTDYPALSAGAVSGWNTDGHQPGVFLGVLPGDHLFDQLPGHPECDDPGSPDADTISLGEATTIVFSGCPRGTVVIERLVEISQSRLLWVQVRADDRATANDVLDSVGVSGS